jgi:PAS domain S-box-containing protein
MLAANQPMFAVWGTGQAMIYNDAYAEILGDHHPAALGAPFFNAWSELVDSVGPILARCYGGEPVYMDDIKLVLRRKGYPEEAHFSFFYAPMHDEAGAIGGVFCACNETTRQVRSRQEQREAETRNRQILDSAIDYAVIATDLEGNVNRWNEGARRIFLWTEAEILGEPIDLIFTPEDRAIGRPSIEMGRAAVSGVGDDERWHIRKSGERFWASGEMTPLKSEAGEIVGFVKVLRDRTDQRVAAGRLLESEVRFRSLVEATPGFAWTAVRDGTVTYMSPRWHEYSGTSPEEGSGDAWTHWVHPDDRESALSAWDASVSSGNLYEVELRLRAADGSYRWWLSRALPTRDETGGIALWAGVCTDIETIAAAREALARSREDLEAQIARRTADRNRMWQLSTDVMLVARFDGSIVAVNPAWTSLLDWSELELVGENFLGFVHSDDGFSTRQAARKLSAGSKVLHFENRYRHRDGSYRWLSWTAVPDQEFIHAVGRDITMDKEKAEALAKTEEALRQSQKMEAVGQLTGGIAHDFNNLLTGITGSLGLLRTRLKQGRMEAIERYISTAEGAAARAAALTHRLLAFSRRQTLDPKPVNVNRLVSDMEELLQRTVGPGIRISTTLTGGVWATLCDASQLDNAILNLCINARDAMPDGGQLAIETENTWLDERQARERDMVPGQYVQISVTDTGAGMLPEVAARAFDPFFTTKPLGTGTGLGLSMIYGFAKQSGGQARIHTQPGTGTTVRIYLPRHSGIAEAEKPDPEVDHAMPGGTAGTVLVVDDEPTIRMLVTEVLEELGYVTLEAEDGPSGLKMLQSDVRIDLLVSDVGLPGGMNGRQMADAARVGRPGLKVLFITGYAENAVIGKAQLESDMHVITKPFAMDMLAIRIRSIIQGGDAAPKPHISFAVASSMSRSDPNLTEPE